MEEQVLRNLSVCRKCQHFVLLTNQRFARCAKDRRRTSFYGQVDAATGVKMELAKPLMVEMGSVAVRLDQWAAQPVPIQECPMALEHTVNMPWHGRLKPSDDAPP